MSGCNHTPAPEGYVAWHTWAGRMSRTHTQHRCPNCGLWAIWKRKRSAASTQPISDYKSGEG